MGDRRDEHAHIAVLITSRGDDDRAWPIL